MNKAEQYMEKVIDELVKSDSDYLSGEIEIDDGTVFKYDVDKYYDKGKTKWTRKKEKTKVIRGKTSASIIRRSGRR